MDLTRPRFSSPHIPFHVLLIGALLTRQVTFGGTEKEFRSSATVELRTDDLDLALIPMAEVYLASESENLTLLSNDGNSEIRIRQEMLRNNQGFHNVVLVCNAPYPIQWIYQGDGVFQKKS